MPTKREWRERALAAETRPVTIRISHPYRDEWYQVVKLQRGITQRVMMMSYVDGQLTSTTVFVELM